MSRFVRNCYRIRAKGGHGTANPLNSLGKQTDGRTLTVSVQRRTPNINDFIATKDTSGAGFNMTHGFGKAVLDAIVAHLNYTYKILPANSALSATAVAEALGR